MALGEIQLKPTVWIRYITDIFLFWTHNEHGKIWLSHMGSMMKEEIKIQLKNCYSLSSLHQECAGKDSKDLQFIHHPVNIQKQFNLIENPLLT